MRTPAITFNKPALSLAAALLFIATALPLHAEDPYPSQTLPGEPPVQPASQGGLSNGDAINLAIDWAKFGQNPTSDKVIDVAITAMTVGYPPAGIALGALKSIFTSMSGGPDPVGEALKVMDKRITALEKNVQQLADALNQIQDRQFAFENRVRIGELQRRRDELKDLRYAIWEKPTTAESKARLTSHALDMANRFLPLNDFDADMWQWSDMRVNNGNGGALKSTMMAPDFKAEPLLDAYANSLLLLMAAIEYEANGNKQLVFNKYSRALMTHVAFLSVRPYWNEGEQPVTLPERIMSRVTCQVNVGTYADRNGMCGASAVCYDTMGRRTTSSALKIPDFPLSPGSTRCSMPVNVPPPMSPDRVVDLQKHPIYGSEAMTQLRTHLDHTVPEEDEIENLHGVELTTQLADQLRHLAVGGTLREQYVGRFDPTTWSLDVLYAVQPNGDLAWYTHMIGVDPTGGRGTGDSNNDRIRATVWKQRSVLESSVSTAAAAAARVSEAQSNAATAAQVGTLKRNAPFRSRLGAKIGTVQESSPGTQVSAVAVARNPALAAEMRQPLPLVKHEWQGPKNVGSGWQNFREVIPAGVFNISSNQSGAGLYGLTRDGVLKWYRHDGFANGELKWKGPVDVGSGWNSFSKIIAMGDGVLYGIAADGSLRWYRHGNAADTGTQASWSGPTVVGSGWGNFVHVFSVGEGVIYAVTPDGRLLWYHHKGYLTGTSDWEGPKQVGTGWAAFKRVFATGQGNIYALSPAGELFWYKNDGYQTGAATWQGPVKIGADWSNYAFVFPAMWGTPQAPIVR